MLTEVARFLLLVLSLLPVSVDSLECMSCVRTPHSTQLDRFRVTTRLIRPECEMEPVPCDRDQDACVTISMHVGSGQFWMGAGCDRRSNFRHLQCENVRTLQRNVQLGFVNERRAVQRVCVCVTDRCNRAFFPSAHPLLFLLSIVLLLLPL
uniref:Protein quiver n=1 Tax=Steinernema glaseri TaxID=37863 RepID=A0A1I7ZQY6_9BILA